jgi:hypothetical protein
MMHIKTLDRIVARRITEGTSRAKFDRAQLARDLDELGTPAEVRESLETISAPTWESFITRAYLGLRSLERALEMPALPSAMDGLQPVRVIDEQVA